MFKFLILFVLIVGVSQINCIGYGTFGTFSYNDVPGNTGINGYSGSVAGYILVNTSTITFRFDIELLMESGGPGFDRFEFNGLGKSNMTSTNQPILVPCTSTGNSTFIKCTSNLIYKVSNLAEYKRILLLVQSGFSNTYVKGYTYIDVFLLGSTTPITRALLTILNEAPCTTYVSETLKTVGFFGNLWNSTNSPTEKKSETIEGLVSGYIQYNTTYFNVTASFKARHSAPFGLQARIQGLAQPLSSDNSLGNAVFVFPYGNSGIPEYQTFVNTGYYLYNGDPNQYQTFIGLIKDAVEQPSIKGTFNILLEDLHLSAMARAELRLYPVDDQVLKVPTCFDMIPQTSTATATTTTTGEQNISSSTILFSNNLLLISIILYYIIYLLF